MKLTASSLSRAKSCLWWARPDAKYDDAPDTGGGDEGTEVHERIARLVNDQLPKIGPPGQRVGALVHSAWHWNVANSCGTMRHVAEEAYAYDVVRGTARVIGVDIGRDYSSCTETEIAGTSDHVFVDADTLVVRDWKTGSPDYVETVAENAQLKFLGLCAALVRGWTGKVRLEIVYVRESQCYPERHETNVAALKEFSVELQMMYIQLGDAPAVSGEHCRFCPARGGCPATTQTVQALATQNALHSDPPGLTIERRLPVWTTALVSLENDSLMAEQLPALKKAVEAVEDALKLRARAAGGITLPDGKVWKEVSYERSQTNMKRVEELLGDRINECRTKVMQTQFKRCKP